MTLLSRLTASAIKTGLRAAFKLPGTLPLPLSLLLWSTLSALAMNAMLMNWHKPGRYQGG